MNSDMKVLKTHTHTHTHTHTPTLTKNTTKEYNDEIKIEKNI